MLFRIGQVHFVGFLGLWYIAPCHLRSALTRLFVPHRCHAANLTYINTGVNISRVGATRTSDDLDIYVGSVRSFEWYWSRNDEMPALDDFETLSDDSRAAIIATLEHWGDLEIGKRVSKTRINEEHDDPKILAAKAGKHRFAMFHAGDNVWIVCRYYEKQKQKLDKTGKSAIKLTIEDQKEYEKRVSVGEYYERR